MSGTTKVKSPAPQQTGDTTTKKTTPTGPSNAGAERKAEVARALKSIPAPWKRVAGGLLEGAAEQPKPTVKKFKEDAYNQMRGFSVIKNGVAEGGPIGVEQLIKYLLLTEQKEYEKALKASKTLGDRDNGPIKQLTDTMMGLCGVTATSTVSLKQLDLLAIYATISGPGKQWLRMAAHIWAPVEVWGHSMIALRPDISKSIISIVNMVKTGDTTKPVEEQKDKREEVPLNPIELGQYAMLRAKIEMTLQKAEKEDEAKKGEPASDEERIAQLRAAQAKRGAGALDHGTFLVLLGEVNSAAEGIKSRLYNEKPKGGKSLMQRLQAQLSPTQMASMTMALDPVEQLYADCQTVGEGDNKRRMNGVASGKRLTDGLKRIEAFLLRHRGDEATRMRVLAHARLMDDFIQQVADSNDEKHAYYMRLILTGKIGKTEIDELQAAARQGDGVTAIKALLALSQKDPQKLSALQTNHVFIHKLRDMTEQVSYNGLKIAPYHLFLRLCGHDPFESKEPGEIDRSKAVNPSSKPEERKPLEPHERIWLDAYLYQVHMPGILEELNASVYCNDSDILDEIRAFVKKFSEPKVVKFLRRANESPGPELHRRLRATGCKVQLKLKRGCDEETIIEVERALGIRGDSATIGVIGGDVRLEGDYDKQNHKEGGGTVPLPQALREMRAHGTTTTLTAWIHKYVEKMHGELTEWTDSDVEDVREIWYDYLGGVPSSLIKKLRQKTGEERLWAIELFSNAYREHAKKGLNAALSHGLDSAKNYKTCCNFMGLTAEDSRFREIMAQKRIKQNDEAAAKKAREQARREARTKDWTPHIKKVWDALSKLRPDSEEEDFKAAGAVFKNANIHQYAGEAKSGAGQPGMHGSNALGPSSIQTAGATQTVNDLYRREYGIFADRQIVEIAKTFAQPPEKSEAVLRGWLGIGALVPAKAAKSDYDVTIKPHERSLVRPKFLVADKDGGSKEARLIAEKIWKDLHKHGQIQILMNELETCSFKEQQLIHSAFRNLSGDLDLRFYIQQMKVKTQKRQSAGEIAKTQIPFRGPDLELLRMQVGAAGSAKGAEVLEKNGLQGKSVTVAGDVPELDDALAITQHGKVPFLDRVKSACDSDNLERLYELIDNATDDEKRALIRDKATYNRLGKTADDPWEWSRIYKGLHGKATLFDMLESRAHGKGVLEAVFGGTDEEGIRKDIKTWIRRRKKELLAQYQKPYRDKNQTPPGPEIAKKIKAQIEADCKALLANPSLTAILRDELSGTELSSIEGLFVAGAKDGDKAGEAESKDAYLLNDGDLTEDEDRIIADIKKMSVKERQERLKDPEFMRRLHDAMDSEEYWRDALMALRSKTEPKDGDDPLLKLEKASRTGDEDSTEINVEESDILKALAELNQDQYKQLMANPRLMAQVMKALKGDDEQKIARQMMSFKFEDATAETGYGISTDGKFDYENGKFPKAEVERLAYLKFNAIQRVRMACSKDGENAWDTLLHGLVEIYKMNLAPDKKAAGAKAPPMPVGGTPKKKTEGNEGKKEEKKKEAPKKGEKPKAKEEPKKKPKTKEDYERELRKEIWKEVDADVKDATNRWWAPDTSELNKYVSSEAAIRKLIDPSSLLLKTHTSWIADNEDGIKKTLKQASVDKLVNDWTTIRRQTPDRMPSMKDVYDDWLKARGGKKDAKTPESDPNKLNDARVKMAIFQNYAIDTSLAFENELIAYAGGLFADDEKFEKGQARFDVRDNAEWLEWRGIIRNRIPSLTKSHKPKVLKAIGATGDKQAEAILDNPNRELLTQFAYDRENYLVNRGEDSNYNMDRLTAGEEGQALDRSFGDYGQTLTNAIVHKDAKKYNEITADEKADVEEKRGLNEDRLKAFKSAKNKVAEIAATIVAIIITAVITILTWGSGAAGAPAIMAALKAAAIGAGTAGAAAVGATATKEAVLGTGYEWGREGLQTIAKDTIMGFVSAGAQYYAGAIVQGAAKWVQNAAGQADGVAKALSGQPPFMASLFMEAGEEALQTGMEGIFEAGMAGFDPALWLQGFSSGWDRASGAVAQRASQIPEDALRAAVSAALTTGISHAAGGLYAGAKKKLGVGGGPDAGDVADGVGDGVGDATDNTIAGAAKRKTYGERTKEVVGKMAGEVPESLTETATDMIMDEKTYRAEGWDDDKLLDKTMKSALDNMKSVAKQLHIADAHLNVRIRRTAHQLQHHGHRLTSNERKQYERMAIASEGSGVMSVGNFIKVRQAHIDNSIATHEAKTGLELTAEQKKAYAIFVRTATTLGEFDANLEKSPSEVPEVASAGGAANASPEVQAARDAAAKEAAKRTKDEQADPTKPAKEVSPELDKAIPEALKHAQATVVDSRLALLARNQAQGAFEGVPEGDRGAVEADYLKANVSWQLAMEAASTANNAVRNLQMAQQAVKILTEKLDAAPKDKKTKKQLYDAVIKARVALALETEVAAAEAKKAKEASLLARAATLDLEAKARRIAAGENLETTMPPKPGKTEPAKTEPAKTDPAADTTPDDKTDAKDDTKTVDPKDEAKAEPPVVNPDEVVNPDAKPTDKDKPKGPDKTDPTKTEPARETKPEAKTDTGKKREGLTLLEQNKLQEFIKIHGVEEGLREFKSWREDQEASNHHQNAEVGASDSLLGSSYRGNVRKKAEPDKIRGEVKRAAAHIQSMFPDGQVKFVAGSGDGAFVIKVGDKTLRMTINVTDPLPGKRPPVATFEYDGDNVIVNLSNQARNKHVERALAHEVAEIIAVEKRRADGKLDAEATADLLSEGSSAQTLSPHDMGRLAELRVLSRQIVEMEVAAQNGDKHAKEQLTHHKNDVRALIMNLGLLSNDQKSVDKRMQALAAVLSQDLMAEVERMIKLAKSDPKAVAEIRERFNRHAEQKRQDREGLPEHGGVEVHSHFLGVAPISVFQQAAVGDGGHLAMLQEIRDILDKPEVGKTEKDGPVRKSAPMTAAVVDGALARINETLMPALKAEQQKTPRNEARIKELEQQIQNEAEAAVRKAMTSSDLTPFDQSYTIRDELIKRHMDKPEDSTQPLDPNDPNGSKQGYRNFTKAAVRALILDGLRYNEQSMSINKMSKGRFDPDMVREVIAEVLAELKAEGKIKPETEFELRWLPMMHTGMLGPPSRDHKYAGDDKFDENLEKVRTLMEGRDDVMGMDIAAPEAAETAWNEIGAERVKKIYQMMAQAAATRGRPLVLRPHVGEGYVDLPAGVDPEKWHRDKGEWDEKAGAPKYVVRARSNLTIILNSLDSIKNGQPELWDPAKVVIRFGHLTHATPEHIAKMAELGIIAEINLGSNVQTRATPQVDAKEAAKGEVNENTTMEGERYDSHSFLTALMQGVQVILSTDAHDVMSTNMSDEYRRAYMILERFFAGELKVKVSKAQANGRGTVPKRPDGQEEGWALLGLKDLNNEERARFEKAYRQLFADAAKYEGDVARQDKDDNKGPGGGLTRRDLAHAAELRILSSRLEALDAKRAQGGKLEGKDAEHEANLRASLNAVIEKMGLTVNDPVALAAKLEGYKELMGADQYKALLDLVLKRSGADEVTDAKSTKQPSEQGVPMDQAAAVAGSKFRGDALDADQARTARTNAILMRKSVGQLIDGGFFEGAGEVILRPSGVKINGRIYKLQTLEVTPDQKLAPVATFDEDNKIIMVSDRARPEDIERALAHEISELLFNQSNEVSGDGPALSADNNKTKMHGHDAGRIAELRVLSARLAKAGNPDAELVRDIMTLCLELRLVSAGGGRLDHNMSMIAQHLASIIPNDSKRKAELEAIKKLVGVANDGRRVNTLEKVHGDVANDARVVVKQRQEAYQKMIDGVDVPEFDVISVGGGPANLINQASLSDKGSAGAGTDVTWPSHVTINAAGPESIGQYGKHRFGQTPGELDSPGMNVSAATKDKTGYTHSDKLANAIVVGEMEQGIAVYRGMVTGTVEYKKPSSKDWKSDKPVRVMVETPAGKKWFYTDRVDLTTGAGVSNEAPMAWFEGKDRDKQAEKRDELKKDGILTNAEAYLGDGGGKVVVVSGGGASGAWACETATQNGAKVIWVGRGKLTEKDNDRLKEVQQQLQSTNDPDEITALLKEREKLVLESYKDAPGANSDTQGPFTGAGLPRNKDTEHAAINNPNVEFVVGSVQAIEKGARGKTATVTINGKKIVADKVVTAHGQSQRRPGASGALTKGLKLRLIKAGDGRVVGLESVNPPGAVRILGAAFAARPGDLVDYIASKDEQAEYMEAVRKQAETLPKDSKGVTASIAMARETITAANDKLLAKEFRLKTQTGEEIVLQQGDEPNWDKVIAQHIAAQLGVPVERIKLQMFSAGKSGDPVYKVMIGAENLGVFKVFAQRGEAVAEFKMIELLQSKELKKYKVVGAKGMGDVSALPGKDPRGAVMMEYAKGDTVADMVKMLPEKDPGRTEGVEGIKKAVQQVARAMSEFHTAFENGKLDKDQKTGDANYMIDKKLRPNAAKFGSDFPAVLAALEALRDEYAASDMKATAYHGDANAGNFIPQDDGDTVRVIDVGTMQWGVDKSGKGTRTGAADAARFLGSLETLFADKPNRLNATELKAIRTAFNRSYFRANGAKPKGWDAAEKLYRVELELAAMRAGGDVAAVVQRIKTVLGIP